MTAIGVDIGGTKIAVGLVAGGKVESRHTAPTPADSPSQIIETVVKLCRPLLDQAAVKGIGIGTAGQVNPHNGVITYAVDTLRGWGGIHLAEEIENRLGLPVKVENDVNSMALGEVIYGAGAGFAHGLYLTIGTGIGGAVVLNGQLWHGAHFSAGEVGHVLVDWHGERLCNCGQYGHLEAYAAGPALEKRYAELSQKNASLREIVSYLQHGDDHARQTLEEGARILGMALIGLVNMLDPQVVVVGGGVAEIGGLWWDTLEKTFRASPMPAPQKTILKPAELGIQATLVGAGYLVTG